MSSLVGNSTHPGGIIPRDAWTNSMAFLDEKSKACMLGTHTLFSQCQPLNYTKGVLEESSSQKRWVDISPDDQSDLRQLALRVLRVVHEKNKLSFISQDIVILYTCDSLRFRAVLINRYDCFFDDASRRKLTALFDSVLRSLPKSLFSVDILASAAVCGKDSLKLALEKASREIITE